MPDAEAAVDPRLVALGLATEIVIEFPAGTVEVDALDAPPVVPERRPVVPEPPPVPSQAVVPPAPIVAPPDEIAITFPIQQDEIPIEFPPELVEDPIPQVETPVAQVETTIVLPIAAEERPAVRLEPTPLPEPLPESAVLIQTSVVHGLWPRRAELTLEELGFRVAGPQPIAIRWSDVTSIDIRRERVSVRATTETVRLALAVDGVAAPELNEAFARVMSEARAGSLDIEGSAVHELQNAMDTVRDTFHSSDDAFIPLALGGALTVLTVILAFAVPEILAFLTRPTVPQNAFVLGARLAPIDPRVLLIALAAAAIATSLTARGALGVHATSWARGTLRGWHIERPSIVAPLRRGLALVFLYPLVAGAALAVSLLVATPSARSHATVDSTGIHVGRPLPFLDRTATWSDVKEIVPLAASGSDHPHGVAVLIRFNDEATVTTLDLPVRNATDRYFLELTRKWYAQAVDARR